MRLRVFGFCFNKKKAPPCFEVSKLYKSLEKKSTLQKPIALRIAVSTVNVKRPKDGEEEAWWVGVVLKVRDSRIFTKLTAKNGKNVVTSELLTGSDSLAEASFFIANPRSGAGLFAHHHQSAGLTTGLAPLLLEEFRIQRDKELKDIEENRDLSIAEKKKKRKEISGFLWFDQLVMPEKFNELVATLKKVDSVRVRLSTILTSPTLFKGYKCLPERETVEYKFPTGVLSDDIGNSLQVALTDNQISKASVTGTDKRGTERTFTHGDNPMLFDDLDYDKIMGDFELDIADYEPSLRKCAAIDHLVALAKSNAIWKLLDAS